MSKDPFNTEMSVEELINYIKRCPKQFVSELPDKLEKYIQSRIIPVATLERKIYSNEEVEAALSKMKASPLIPIQSPDEQLRTEIATSIMVKHAPHAAMNMELLADYCVEGADELIKRLKRC